MCGFDIRPFFARLCSETISGALRTPPFGVRLEPEAVYLGAAEHFCSATLFSRFVPGFLGDGWQGEELDGGGGPRLGGLHNRGVETPPTPFPESPRISTGEEEEGGGRKEGMLSHVGYLAPQGRRILYKGAS